MENIFDNLSSTAFNVVSATMGYPATWVPAAGGATKQARVLYKDATARMDIIDAEFQNEKYMMEFQPSDFPGLRESVKLGEIEAVTITIKAVPVPFYIRRIETKFDGKTFVAYLQEQ
jgi:hypothetical protein